MSEVSKTAVQGLRSSDPTTLSVLIQDLLRVPLVRLDLQTHCDLIALGEPQALSKITNRELVRFRERMEREYNDLPDGPLLYEHLDELAALPAAQVPATWREIVLQRREEASAPAQQRMGELASGWETTTPEIVSIATRRTSRVERFETPASHRSPQDRERDRGRRRLRADRSRSSGRASTGRASTPRPATPRAPARVRDPRRAEWIREDIVDRLRSLNAYGVFA